MGLFSKKKIEEPGSICDSIIIGGEAGEGIKSAGKICATALIKSNYNVFVYDEYPSLIRGGHNSVNITYSKYQVYSHNREISTLACLNKDTFEQHKDNITSKTIVIYDRDDFEFSQDELTNYPCELIEIPAEEIIKKHNLPKIVRNVIFISASLLISGIQKEVVIKAIKDEFSKNKNIDKNIEAVNILYENLYEYFNLKELDNLIAQENNEMNPLNEDTYLMSGNDAIALGAIKSGLKFYAAYPMTPATTILETLFELAPDYNIIVKQAEDEIAAINMAIGASYSGARAMVGTSGGGFSLMVEGLGLAAITESPLVIVISQRPGPATGLPTWTGQADLLFALHASQDEFPRVILTPGDIEECFTLAFTALNIAEKYQVQVIILTDKYLSESMQQIKFTDIDKLKIDRGLILNERILNRLENFDRYELTPSGISPRSLPGQKNGVFIANSDEGDTKGYSNESSQNRINKVQKRFNKVKSIKNDLPQVNIYGDSKSSIGIICWGSTKAPSLEAMRRLQSINSPTKLIALNYIEPFPNKEISDFIKNTKNIILIEGNFTSQLGQLILKNTDYEIENKLLKFDGRPIHPDEIVKYILTLS